MAAGVAINLAMSAVDFYTTSWIIKHAYPIVQAYLMMFFIAMLPFMLVASMLEIGRLLQMVLIFLAIQFLSPWRHVVEYLDERLFEIMYPENTWESLGTDLILKTPERILIDLTSTTMYTVFPVILMWLVALTGVQGANSVGTLMSQSNLSQVSQGMIRGLNGGVGRLANTVGGKWSKAQKK